MGDIGYEVRIINEIKGKGLFATKYYKTGDLIFKEKPLVFCQFTWNAACGYLACDNCLRPLETAEENARRLTGKHDLILPYPECCGTDKSRVTFCQECGVQYCSPECYTDALQQYHNVLCIRTHGRQTGHPIEQLNEVWRQMHYPPETTSIMLFARILAIIQQASDRNAAIQKFMQFCHRTTNEQDKIAHKLLGAQFSVQLEVLRNLMKNAIPCEGIENWMDPEGFRNIFALIGTNGQGVGTSPISNWYYKVIELSLPEREKAELEAFIDKLYEDMNEKSGTFLNNEGSALYALQSACNHSCDPNAEPAFQDNNFILSMLAKKDINPGEEICISYLDDCILDRSRHSRQKFLADNYLFLCKCFKCESQAGDPDVTSEESDEESDD